MTTLNRKLARDLWQLKTQVLAIALVIASGAALLIMALTTTEALKATTAAYYQRARFADVFAQVKRAPDSILRNIVAIPGCAAVETRIVETAMLDVRGHREPVVGQVLSLPNHGPQFLNAIVLRSGRLPTPDRPDEVVISEPFADAHGLVPGGTLSAILHGRRRILQIVGTALSPEYVYAIPPGGLMPDDRRFGVLWMGRDALAAAFGLKGAFNNVALRLARKGNAQAVIARLDTLLAPYGGTGAYPRAEQISNWFLQNEIAQQENMARLLPVIFLAVAAFLTNMVMARLIVTERREIGLLKAFGYSDWEIGWHYGKMVLAIGALGTLVGSLLGATLGHWETEIYRESFRFPFLLYRPSPHSFVAATLIGLTASLAGGLGAVARVVRLPPAAAILPPAPTSYRRGWMSCIALARIFDQPTRMIFRRLLRWPLRAFLASAGLAMSVAVLIVALQWLDAVNTLVESYYVQGQHQDATVAFNDLLPASAAEDFKRLPGVLAVEPFRIVPARFVHGTRSEREAIIGVPAGVTLSPVYDSEGGRIDTPPNGLLLSHKLAELLNVRIGDKVAVHLLEGRRQRVMLPVTRIFDTYISKPAYVNLAALNRLMNDGRVLTGLQVAVDAPSRVAFLAQLKDIPNLAAVLFRKAAIDKFYETIGQTLLVFVGFFVAFASALSVGVIYSSLRIALSERARELATLRVLGFSRWEVSYILLGEVGILTWIAIPLGCIGGYVLALHLASSFETELFRVPLVILDATYGKAALVTLATAIACAVVLHRRLDRLDLIPVLKTRE